MRIHKILLKPEERAPGFLKIRGRFPLKCGTRDFLINDTASRGDEVEIETYYRPPDYRVSIGKESSIWTIPGVCCIPETLHIGRQVKTDPGRKREAAG